MIFLFLFWRTLQLICQFFSSTSQIFLFTRTKKWSLIDKIQISSVIVKTIFLVSASFKALKFLFLWLTRFFIVNVLFFSLRKYVVLVFDIVVLCIPLKIILKRSLQGIVLRSSNQLLTFSLKIFLVILFEFWQINLYRDHEIQKEMFSMLREDWWYIEYPSSWKDVACIQVLCLSRPSIKSFEKSSFDWFFTWDTSRLTHLNFY